MENWEKINTYINLIEDPIVRNASFMPIKKSGAFIIEGTELIIDNGGNITFKINSFLQNFIYIAPFMSLLILFIPLYFSINKPITLNVISDYLIIIIPYLVSLVGSLVLVNGGMRSYTFDFQNGYFYDIKYKNNFSKLFNQEKYKNKIILINQIHALQIISKIEYTKYGSYTNYILNIILKDSNTLQITSSSEIEKVRNNANIIAEKLGVKIYDITQI